MPGRSRRSIRSTVMVTFRRGRKTPSAANTQPKARTHAAFQVRMLARIGHREDAAPDAAGADQHDIGLRAAFQQVGHGPRGADFLDSPPLGPAGRIDQEALAAVQPRGDGVDHRQRLFAGVAAMLVQVRHLDRVDQPHERIEQRLAIHARGDDRPHPARNADVRQHQRRIDQPRVIGHHQRRAAEVAEFLQSFHADPVAEPGQEANQHPVTSPHPLHGVVPLECGGLPPLSESASRDLECNRAADASCREKRAAIVPRTPKGPTSCPPLPSP